jgi:hypothetical protein
VADAATLAELGGASAEARGIAALLFLNGGMVVLDAYSTLNSSPWTAESFGGDPEKMKSLREYVTHAAVYSTANLAAAAIVSKSAFPLYAAVLNNAYLVYLYRRAARRGQASGSEGWGTGGTPGKGATW